MQATKRFRTLSLAAAGARQRAMKGKDAGVQPQEIPVALDTLAHARVVGEANRWARRLLFRGVANNARLVNCPEGIRERAINLLSAELQAIDLRISDPWKRLVARCKAIARHGIGNCHECSELTFLYLVVMLPGLQIDQVLYSHRDHVATLVTSGAHVIRADPRTAVAVPVLQEHGNKRLDVDLLTLQMESLGLGGGSGTGKLLRSCRTLTNAQRLTLQQAVAELDRLTPAECLGDEAILAARKPPATTRTGASMDDGSEWPLSKRRPVTALVHGDQRLDLDAYPVNDYFHVLFNPMPRRDDAPFPAGCFDFADAIERLLGNDPQPLLGLVEHHGFNADTVAPLLIELFNLAIHDEPTRCDALRRLDASWPVSIEKVNV
jgi:hypothetical protein